MLASNREDLLNKLESLNQSHRLCSMHFEEKMYMNKECKRLLHNAIPTLFACLEGGSKSADHTYSRCPLITVGSENKENEGKIIYCCHESNINFKHIIEDAYM